MNIKDIIKNPIFWVGTSVVTIIIIMIVIINNQNKSSTTTTTCKDNQMLCGSTCYDPTVNDCVGGSLCSLQDVCRLPGQDPICCKASDNQQCDPNNPGKCKKCDTICDDGDCCKGADMSCWGGHCCPNPAHTTDSNGNQVCCTIDIGHICGSGDTKTCCLNSDSKICSTDGKCVIGCPDIRLSQSDFDALYSCDGNPVKKPDSVSLACASGQYCNLQCSPGSSGIYSCNDKKCTWSLAGYDKITPLEDSNQNQINITLAAGGTKSLYVCAGNDGNEYLSSTVPKGGFANASMTISSDKVGPGCDCNSTSFFDTVGVDIGKSTVTKKGNTCKASIGCDEKGVLLDNTTDIETACKAAGGSRCCTDINGNYTGQVCALGQSCVNGVCQDPPYFAYKPYNNNPLVYQCVEAIKGDTIKYGSYSSCLKDHTDPLKPPICPPDTADCTKNNSCWCCGNWAVADGTCDPLVMFPFATQDSAQGINPPGLTLDQITIYVNYYMFYLYIPSDIEVTVTKNQNISTITQQTAIQSNILPYLYYNVWECDKINDQEGNVIVTLTDPKDNKTQYKYLVGLQEGSHIRIDSSVGGSAVDYVVSQPLTDGSPPNTFGGSTRWDIVNGCAMIGDKIQQQIPSAKGRPSYVFLNIPLEINKIPANPYVASPSTKGEKQHTGSPSSSASPGNGKGRYSYTPLVIIFSVLLLLVLLSTFLLIK